MSIDKKTLRRIFFGVAGCIILFWLLHETERVASVLKFFRSMLLPFAAGAIIAFVLNVPMRFIENHLGFIKHTAIRRAVALTITLGFLLLCLVLIIYLLIPQVMQTAVSLYYQINDLFKKYPILLKWLQQEEGITSLDWAVLAKKAVELMGGGIPSLVNGAFSAIGSVYNGLLNTVITIVFAVYCLARKDILARQFKKLAYAFLPEKHCDNLIHIFRLTNQTFSSFISGQCIEACILGGLFAIAMTIFKMPYVPLISVLIAVTALIPIVGAFIGCGLGALFILVGNPMQALWFVVMFLIIQQLENNIIYPKVVGKSVGLPGMWVLVAVTVGGALMGVVGMVLMIPLVSVFYTLLREATEKRLAEREIAPEKTQNPPVLFKIGGKKKRESIETDENETR